MIDRDSKYDLEMFLHRLEKNVQSAKEAIDEVEETKDELEVFIQGLEEEDE